jgi:hypothetical protein
MTPCGKRRSHFYHSPNFASSEKIIPQIPGNDAGSVAKEEWKTK